MADLKEKILIPVVVTTEHRGVFFGYAKELTMPEITLEKARMCVYWSADVKGVVGLAATGPTKGCRITAPAPSMQLNKITCVMRCNDLAAQAWETSAWNL